tara:strand:- start:19462 stop:20394 length:933 start_codon:yes stop_codon:yes gene_type:complete
MADTALFFHKSCLGHEPGVNHPESPNRLVSIEKYLSSENFKELLRFDSPLANISDLKHVHASGHVDEIFELIPSSGYEFVDGDTVLSPKSGEAALRSVGAACAAVDKVLSKEVDNAFCALRPPGHHAEPSRSMGFCLFNNVAIAADHARRVHGLTRVAVVDFDVHHGNGTQAAFEKDGDLFFASTHQFPFYPGTGNIDETGVGNIVNVPLKHSTDSEAFRLAIIEKVLPALRRHEPEIIILSAGFDAHYQDPLASLNLVEDDYRWITWELVRVANEKCDGQIVSCLEGGYNIDALGRSVAAHVGALMEAN